MKKLFLFCLLCIPYSSFGYNIQYILPQLWEAYEFTWEYNYWGCQELNNICIQSKDTESISLKILDKNKMPSLQIDNINLFFSNWEEKNNFESNDILTITKTNNWTYSISFPREIILDLWLKDLSISKLKTKKLEVLNSGSFYKLNWVISGDITIWNFWNTTTVYKKENISINEKELLINTKEQTIFIWDELYQITQEELLDFSDIVSQSIVTTQKNPFTDIENSFAKDYILNLYSQWIIKWYWDWTFRPNNSVTRWEFLSMIMKKSKIDVSSYKNYFTDISGWVVPYAETAREKWFIQTSENFRPNNLITRAEAIKILLNVSWKEIKLFTSSTYSDVDWWKINFIETARELGIINSADKFRPNDSISRAETSKIIDLLN